MLSYGSKEEALKIIVPLNNILKSVKTWFLDKQSKKLDRQIFFNFAKFVFLPVKRVMTQTKVNVVLGKL